MAYSVVLDPVVAERTEEITSYICDVLASPATAAADFLNKFDALVTILERLPLSYPHPQDARLEARGRSATMAKGV